MAPRAQEISRVPGRRMSMPARTLGELGRLDEAEALTKRSDFAGSRTSFTAGWSTPASRRKRRNWAKARTRWEQVSHQFGHVLGGARAGSHDACAGPNGRSRTLSSGDALEIRVRSRGGYRLGASCRTARQPRTGLGTMDGRAKTLSTVPLGISGNRQIAANSLELPVTWKRSCAMRRSVFPAADWPRADWPRADWPRADCAALTDQHH